MRVKNGDIDQWRKVGKPYCLCNCVVTMNLLSAETLSSLWKYWWKIRIYTDLFYQDHFRCNIFWTFWSYHLKLTSIYHFVEYFLSFHEFPHPQQVEMPTEFALSEVDSPKTPPAGNKSLAMPLQSCDQLTDHDDACREGRSVHKKIIHFSLERCYLYIGDLWACAVAGQIMIFRVLRPAARALLGDWLGSKLQLELEMEDDDLTCTAERKSQVSRPNSLNYNNFDGTEHKDKLFPTWE